MRLPEMRVAELFGTSLRFNGVMNKAIRGGFQTGLNSKVLCLPGA